MTGSPPSHIVSAVPVHAMHGRQAGRQESALCWLRRCGVRTLPSDDGHAGGWKRVCICMQSIGKIWWICCRRDIYPHRQVACQLPRLFRYSDVSRTSPATQSVSIQLHVFLQRPLPFKSISSYSSQDRPSLRTRLPTPKLSPTHLNRH